MKHIRPNSKSIHRAHTRAAFTLVELLITITIILALASLAFMGLGKMRTAADRTLALGNLSQLQIANASYATENNGRFVATFTKNERGKTGGLWDRNSGFLDEYIGAETFSDSKKQEKRVPTSSLDPVAYRAAMAGHDTLKASYGMFSKEGYTANSKDIDSSYLMSELTQPHRTAAFTTALNWLVQYGGRFHWKGVEGKVNAPAMAYRHNNKALVAYYDGHVGEVTKATLKDIDKRGGKSHPFWSGTAD